MDGLRRDAFSALSTIKNKLDVRTIAAYNRKIDDTNRKDMLEKYINAFKVINTKKTEEIITIKTIKQEKKENKEQTPRLRCFLNCVCFRLLKLSNRLLSC